MAANTAILLIDPYNDFLHPQGKLNKAVSESLETTGTIEHLKELVSAARRHKIPIFYGLHQQTDTHSFQDWQFMNRSLSAIQKSTAFEKDSWGAQIFEGLEPQFGSGDVVVSKHWNSSSFHNTDLDYQLLQRGVQNLVIAGMIANTCVEATARYAYELGYTLTMINKIRWHCGFQYGSEGRWHAANLAAVCQYGHHYAEVGSEPGTYEAVKSHALDLQGGLLSLLTIKVMKLLCEFKKS